jgi:hypothetical protein
MAALDSRLKSAENLIQTIEKYRFIGLSRGRETAVS